MPWHALTELVNGQHRSTGKVRVTIPAGLQQAMFNVSSGIPQA